MRHFVAALFVVVESAAVWVTARRIAAAVVGDDGSVVHRAFVAIVAATVEITGVTQLLGVVGMLSRIPVAVVDIVLAIAVLGLTRPPDRDARRHAPHYVTVPL